jgi:hypothetical protein
LKVGASRGRRTARCLRDAKFAKPKILHQGLTSEEHMVRKRGGVSRGAGRGAALAGLVGKAAGRIWRRIARRPVDSVAIFGAAGASLIIIINAVFLQSGSQRAPFVANPAAPPQLAESRSNIAPATPGAADVRPQAGQQAPLPVAARRIDPIGDLIGASVGSLRRGRTVE